jgi:hypothetical protein
VTEIFEDDAAFFAPEWFYRNLVEDSFPWNLGRVMSFSDFESKYTLHDSDWVSTNIARGLDSLTLAISWDIVCLPESLTKQIETELDRVYLLIRLSGVEEVTIPTCSIPSSSFIGTIIGHELVETDTKKILSIGDAAGGDIDITYTGTETFLAITERETILEL